MNFPRPSEFAVSGVYDAGVPNMERIILRAASWVKLNDFGIFIVKSEGEALIPRESPLFWFPAIWVSPGDWLVLYTGSGQHSTIHSTEGVPMHLFYWSQKTTLFRREEKDLFPVVMKMSAFAPIPVHDSSATKPFLARNWPQR
jgi:hypothetical protein